MYLELQGACGSCPSSAMTLQMGLERGLREKIPEIIRVEEARCLRPTSNTLKRSAKDTPHSAEHSSTKRSMRYTTIFKEAFSTLKLKGDQTR